MNSAIQHKLERLDYSLRRYYVDQYHIQYAGRIPPGSWVLDLGGNKTQKRGVFDIRNYDLNVIYANLSNAKPPDVLSDASQLPFIDSYFDVVICSEVLEHVQDPPAILNEAFRVLRKEGVLLICVPFLLRIHGDPYDFGRYTDQYWRVHLLEAGFKDIEIKIHGLFWSVLVEMIRSWWYDLDITGRLYFRRMAIRFMARLKHSAINRDAYIETQNDPFFSSFTTGYGITASKSFEKQ